MLDATEATLGLDDVKVHQPVDVDFGAIRFMLPTLSFIMVISPKVPSTGAIATTVNFIEDDAAFQFRV